MSNLTLGPLPPPQRTAVRQDLTHEQAWAQYFSQLDSWVRTIYALGLTGADILSSPYTITLDVYVPVIVAGPVTINLPLGAARLINGMAVGVRVKDVSGLAGTNNITIAANGSEGAYKIDGATTKVINTNYGTFFFTPRNNGWMVSP